MIPHKHINFVLGKDFIIEGFYFVPEKLHYPGMLQFGKRVTNPEIICRVNKILNKLKEGSIYKGLRRVFPFFSDDIVIINDFVPAPAHADTLTRFIHYSRIEYVQRLEKLFIGNKKISIEFNEVKIKSYPFAHKVFGIQLR